jgi:hypothetical protein
MNLIVVRSPVKRRQARHATPRALVMPCAVTALRACSGHAMDALWVAWAAKGCRSGLCIWASAQEATVALGSSVA